MKHVALFPLILVAACSSGPTKQESLKVFAATSSALATAQSDAVASAHANVAPSDLAIDFSGPCALGGTVAMTGSYDDTGSGSNAAFDLSTSFTNCQGPGGTLDGDLHWTSVSTGTQFDATWTGSIDWSDANDSASCDIDMQLTVDGTSVTYAGSLCGYDVNAELHLGS